ncbi:MAG: hypothetical protein KIS90_05680, partial [Phenylobacterium sp.]|nr:hypothetical protein [Phenylobacterium sp.]
PNRYSAAASRCYTPEWVNRLARGFARNLTIPHRFVVLTDRHYDGFDAEVTQERLSTDTPDWASMIEPFRIDGPLIVAGLDTVVCGNIDHLAAWCAVGDRIALPRSPGKDYPCNGIALVPAGFRSVYEDWDGVTNDMEWLRRQPYMLIEKISATAVVSYKCDVRPNGLGDARVVYMHGRPKLDELGDLEWIKAHWR